VIRVHAVGSSFGWPAEVVAIFATEAEAQRHADVCGWEVDVFPVAVYEAYDDVSVPLRETDTGLNALELADEIAFAALLDDADPPPAVIYGVAAEHAPREISVFYAAREEAERHVAEGVYTSVVVEAFVHRSHLEPGVGESDRLGYGSQLIRRRHRS
jgi:hypothetical protein